jgi:polyhydroxyalkanoate synthase
MNQPHSGPANAVPSDAEVFASNMARLMEESGKAIAAYMRPREEGRIKAETSNEIVDVVKTIGQIAEDWMSDPARTMEAQTRLAGGFINLWASTLKKMNGEDAPVVAAPALGDKRFSDPTWSENPIFDFIKQAYLHTSRWAEDMVSEAQSIDPHTRHKAGFYVHQISNALAPSNFIFTNPELLRETLNSKGENLVRGMRMLAEDVTEGQGHLKIRQSSPANFVLGENIAVTPGKVVFRNDLMELLQYEPSTPAVRARPVVIVPPWINKYYILDLNSQKSFIKWAVDQGLTVFCVSWVNPGPEQREKSFEDYMRDGILAAVEAARSITKQQQVDAVGYCVGGTLMSIALAHLAALGQQPIATATLLTTQVDFTGAGDLRVFVDDEQLRALEERMLDMGYLEGRTMANAFNMLRANDLIWPYVINNYLRGIEPMPFDLLYWNADSTRMPAANHAFYLRNFYLENKLARGLLTMSGTLIDLSKITLPIYSLATREDHIAPAASVFYGNSLFGGPVRFVLAGSGHIAGVVNPPHKKKYHHWIGPEKTQTCETLEHWMQTARETDGSWWPDWVNWLQKHDNSQIKASSSLGNAQYPPLDDAPGTYVRQKA